MLKPWVETSTASLCSGRRCTQTVGSVSSYTTQPYHCVILQVLCGCVIVARHLPLLVHAAPPYLSTLWSIAMLLMLPPPPQFSLPFRSLSSLNSSGKALLMIRTYCRNFGAKDQDSSSSSQSPDSAKSPVVGTRQYSPALHARDRSMRH
jgi:hypothetical protein